MDTQTEVALLPLPSDPETMILRRDVPRYLPVAAQTLAKLAVIGGGPRYSKLGRRAAYRSGDLMEWRDSRSRLNTSSGHGR